MMVTSSLPSLLPEMSHGWQSGDPERLLREALRGRVLVKCASGSGIATRSSMHGEAESITAVCVANLLPRPAVEAALVVKPDSFLVAPSKIIINRHNTSRWASQIDISRHSNLVLDISDRRCLSSFHPVLQGGACTA